MVKGHRVAASPAKSREAPSIRRVRVSSSVKRSSWKLSLPQRRMESHVTAEVRQISTP